MNAVSVRLQREVEKLMTKPPPGITCYPDNDKLTKLNASVLGASGSPYENGIFKISIDISAKYPFDPPRIRFITKIYHPNIDEAGRICLDLLKVQPEGNWRPTLTIEGLLIAVQLLMTQPNSDDPLVESIANEFRYNKSEFLRKAQEWTAKCILFYSKFVKNLSTWNNCPVGKASDDSYYLEYTCDSKFVFPNKEK